MEDFAKPALDADAELCSVDTNYIVYLLFNDSNPCTYVGSTNNFARRIRQHNGEITGGARYTERNRPNLGVWKIYGFIENLTKHNALSIEKKIQIRSRKMKQKRAIERRLTAIFEILEELNNPEIVFCQGSPAN